MTVKELREQSRMTQAEFSKYLKIPIRTIQEWEQGRRTPPDYVVELIRYKVEKERVGLLRLVELNEGKWLPPIPVNVGTDTDDDLSVVIRKVKKKKIEP